MRSSIDCDEARRSGQHEDEESCGSRSQFVRARIGPVGEELEKHQVVILTVDEVIAHIGDEIHEWRNLSALDRLDQMGLCIAGICESPWLSGARAAYDLMAIEGMAEQFGGLPEAGGWLDQPYAYLQAFSVIRATQNRIQERNLKAARENARGG